MPIVIGARYNPYSFDDMLKPLAMAQQEYNTVQEGLSALTDSSNQFSRYLEGTQAGERVKQYNAAIDTAVTDMAKNGLRKTNRDTLLGLKRQYNNDIAKINQSAAQLDTLYKGVQAARLKAQASGDTLFVANMPNVDTLLTDPSASPTMVSGMGLQKQGMQAAQAASLRNVLNSTKAGQGVMRMYNEIVQGYGYGSAEAQRFLENAASIPELKQALDTISQMYNVDSLGADSGRAKQFIMQGIMDGLTTQQKSTYTEDPEKKAALDLSMYKQKVDYQTEAAIRQKYAEEEAKAQAAAANGGLGSGSVEGIYSQNFVTTNGNSIAQVQQAINGLHASNGGLSSAVFGKTWGNVNPMKLYEQYVNQNSYSRRAMGVQVPVKPWGTPDAKTTTEFAKAHGAGRLLTSQEYKALKDLGYTSDNFFQKAGSYHNFKQSLNTQIDELAHNTAIYNINGGETNKRITARVLENADLFGENNPDATLVQEFERGKKKGNVSPTKLRKDMEKGEQFTLGLSKEGLVLTSSIGGKQYIIAPELISAEAKNAIDALPTNIQKALVAQEKTFMEWYGRKPTKAEKQRLESDAYQATVKGIASSVGVDIVQSLPETNKGAE